MIIKLSNELSVNINLKKYLIKKEDSKSKFQLSIRKQLIKKYPNDNIFEEVFIPIQRFYLDFFLPSRSLVVECQGRQHSEHIKFFHKTKVDFHKQQETDRRKREFCKLNNFKLIEIYNE